MIVFHLAITCAGGALERRQPLQEQHLAQLDAWRRGGIVIGGGSAPDGATADLVIRLQQAEQLRHLWADDELVKAGLWTGFTPRSFAEFVEPWRLPPVDASRRATVIEGPTTDHDMAQFALLELRGAGRLAFGGCFEGGDTWALCPTPDAARVLDAFAETGFWARERLSARPLHYAL